MAGQLVDSNDSEKWFYNKFVLFRVIEINKTSLSHIKPDLVYDEWVYAVMYDWVGDELIPIEQIQSLEYCNELKELDLATAEWARCHNKKLEGFKLVDLNWPKKIIKFSLIESDYKFMVSSDFKYHLSGGTGGNIFKVMDIYDQHFKKVYEKCNNIQNLKGIDDLNGSMGNSNIL